MKAIILAAGLGTRLGKYTEELPKCMLEFEGSPLIERQVATLRAAGVDDITIVRGYRPEKITVEGVRYRENPIYDQTNMVATLMAAEDEFLRSSNGVLVCYADIIYEKRLIETLAGASADVNVLADEDWLPYWKARLDDWKSDVESLQFDAGDRITEIGTPRCRLEEAKARYIGLLKFSPEGARQFSSAFHENREIHWNHDAPWQKSKSFQKAYMTCMIQELVDRGVDTRVTRVKNGWMEFDTVEDYEKAVGWVKAGEIRRFIDLAKTGAAA